jgi:hypothetical protein
MMVRSYLYYLHDHVLILTPSGYKLVHNTWLEWLGGAIDYGSPDYKTFGALQFEESNNIYRMVTEIMDFGIIRGGTIRNYRSHPYRLYWVMHDDESWEYFSHLVLPFTDGYSRTYYEYSYNYYPSYYKWSHRPLDNSWLMGVFDMSCSIVLSRNRIMIKFGRIDEKYVDGLLSFGGNKSMVRKKGGNDVYTWALEGRKDVESFYLYSRRYRSYSWKSNRLDLIPTFYFLRDMRAYRPESPYHDEYLKFVNRWDCS